MSRGLPWSDFHGIIKKGNGKKTKKEKDTPEHVWDSNQRGRGIQRWTRGSHS